MAKENSQFVPSILKILIDIAAGRFLLSETDVLEESDSSFQEILMGLLHLQEEVIFKQEQLTTATQLARERELKYQKILDTSPISILEVNIGVQTFDSIHQLLMSLGTTSSILSINQVGLNLFGAKTPEEVFLHTNDLVRIQVPENVHQSQPSWETDATLVMSSGKTIPILARCSSLEKNAAGENIILTIIDISELKKLEAQFLQVQKMESIGRLAGGIAHDFNNLLTIINCYANMLTVDESDQKRLEKITIILDTGERAAQLTQQLLAFSRQQIISPRVLNINQVIGDMEKMFHRLIGEDIQLQFKQSARIGQIKMDKGQLEQILLNLIVNARDAMPKGGKITIETANQELSKGQIQKHFDSMQGKFVMLAVSDTGIGMNKETAEKIFEPFFTTKEVGKGTGLGLSTVHGIVKQHKGNIWVYSEPGKGTSFKLFFPRLEESMPDLEVTKVTETIPRGSETILVVEDERIVRKAIVEILRENGHTIIEAMDGIEAMKLLNEANGRVDLVLTDVVMPNMSGRELIDSIKKTHKGIKSLFVSGYTADAIVHHGILEEGVNFLHKPFLPSELLHMVRRVLDNKGCEEV